MRPLFPEGGRICYIFPFLHSDIVNKRIYISSHVQSEKARISSAQSRSDQSIRDQKREPDDPNYTVLKRRLTLINDGLRKTGILAT